MKLSSLACAIIPGTNITLIQNNEQIYDGECDLIELIRKYGQLKVLGIEPEHKHFIIEVV